MSDDIKRLADEYHLGPGWPLHNRTALHAAIDAQAAEMERLKAINAELLEALRLMVSTVDSHLGGLTRYPPFQKAVAAIKKAEAT